MDYNSQKGEGEGGMVDDVKCSGEKASAGKFPDQVVSNRSNSCCHDNFIILVFTLNHSHDFNMTLRKNAMKSSSYHHHLVSEEPIVPQEMVEHLRQAARLHQQQELGEIDPNLVEWLRAFCK
jgi:hypothetical protein